MRRTILFFLGSSLLFSICARGIAQEEKAKEQKAQEQKQRADKDWVVELKTLLVQLQAVVTDREGRLVDGLKKENFELREKGRLQDISFFAEHRVGPISISQPVTVASVPNPDDPPPPIGEPNRSLLLFVDTLHMSATNIPRIKQSLKKFIDEQLTDQDAVMLLTSSGSEGIPARFTRDKNLLKHFVSKIAVWETPRNSRFSPALAAAVMRDSQEAIDVAIKLLESEEMLDTTDMAESVLRQIAKGKAGEVLNAANHKRSSLLGTFLAASELMSRAPGQRVLLFFSDGFSMFGSRGDTETQDLQLAVSKAVRSGVVVHSINSKGLEAPAEIDASRRRLAVNSQTGVFDPSLIARLSRYVSDSEKEAHNGMNALAADTGGTSHFRTNDVNWALKKSFEGNNIYYALAYYPSSEGAGFREITLRVKGHPEYTVRTQKGYFTSDAVKTVKAKAAKTPQQQLFEAMARPIPETAINVSTRAHYLEVGNDAAQVSIEVQMSGSPLTYQEQLDRALLTVEIAGSVFDRGGKLVTSFIEKITGNVPLVRLNDVKRSGFSYAKRIMLKPGFYQVRVGVLEPESENIGTASSWVEVPDLSKGKLALSSILLGSAASEQKPVTYTDQLSAVKSYKRGSMLLYYLMLYNAASTVGGDLTIRSELYLNDKIIYESEPHAVSSRMIGRDDKGIEIGGQLNLDLDPGLYELRVAIKDKSNNEFTRSVDFLVER